MNTADQLQTRALRMLGDGLYHEPAALLWAYRTAFPPAPELSRAGVAPEVPLSLDERRIALTECL